MRAAVRRSTRVGARSGVPLEDLGVEPNVLYEMTRQDVLGDNENLIAFCAKELSEMERQVLTLTTSPSAPVGELTLHTEKLDRVDIAMNGRVVHSVDVTDGIAKLTLPKAAPAQGIQASGYRKGKLVVRARLTG